MVRWWASCLDAAHERILGISGTRAEGLCERLKGDAAIKACDQAIRHNPNARLYSDLNMIWFVKREDGVPDHT